MNLPRRRGPWILGGSILLVWIGFFLILYFATIPLLGPRPAERWIRSAGESRVNIPIIEKTAPDLEVLGEPIQIRKYYRGIRWDPKGSGGELSNWGLNRYYLVNNGFDLQFAVNIDTFLLENNWTRGRAEEKHFMDFTDWENRWYKSRDYKSFDYTKTIEGKRVCLTFNFFEEPKESYQFHKTFNVWQYTSIC